MQKFESIVCLIKLLILYYNIDVHVCLLLFPALPSGIREYKKGSSPSVHIAVHQSVRSSNSCVFPAVLTHLSMVAGWIFFILDTMNR